MYVYPYHVLGVRTKEHASIVRSAKKLLLSCATIRRAAAAQRRIAVSNPGVQSGCLTRVSDLSVHVEIHVSV